MNKKEIAEIRRRFKTNQNCFSHIRGCYVNELGHIVSQFDQSLANMSEDETDLFLKVIRKTLSGSTGKNLVDIEFPTNQVANGADHKLLMKLRDTELTDNGAVLSIYNKIIQTVGIEGNYLILLVHDSYDVPNRTKGGDEKMDDASDEVFNYILCSICPVKETKPALSYKTKENELHNRHMDKLVSAPIVGFMFPAFDNRSTNLYNALCYTKDPSNSHEELIKNVFGITAPMPAVAQKNAFHSILRETLEQDYDYATVNTFQDKINEMIEDHKIQKTKEPLSLSCDATKSVLRACGITTAQANEFAEKFEKTFGKDTELNPIVFDAKKKELRTPDVVVKVLNPERGDLVETRVINGKKYILVCAEDGVEVNGVEIAIT